MKKNVAGRFSICGAGLIPCRAPAIKITTPKGAAIFMIECCSNICTYEFKQNIIEAQRNGFNSERRGNRVSVHRLLKKVGASDTKLAPT